MLSLPAAVHSYVGTPAPAALAPARAVSPSMSTRKAGWFPGGVAPSYLDGSMAGDVGFDPLSLVALAPTGTAFDREGSVWKDFDRKTQLLMMPEYERQRKVKFMREAEIKHARLAMMAAAGWPVSELIDGPLSKLLGLPSVMDATNGRAPSVFNGHLLDGVQGGFLLLAVVATSYLEYKTLDNVEGLTPTGYVAGDLGFDPAGLRGKRADMELAEIKNGRLAMLAVTGFAVQEFFYGTPVVEQTPQFFHPHF